MNLIHCLIRALKIICWKKNNHTDYPVKVSDQNSADYYYGLIDLCFYLSLSLYI